MAYATLDPTTIEELNVSHIKLPLVLDLIPSCPKCGCTIIKFISNPIAIALECSECLTCGPIKTNPEEAIRAWIEFAMKEKEATKPRFKIGHSVKLKHSNSIHEIISIYRAFEKDGFVYRLSQNGKLVNEIASEEDLDFHEEIMIPIRELENIVKAFTNKASGVLSILISPNNQDPYWNGYENASSILLALLKEIIEKYQKDKKQ